MIALRHPSLARARDACGSLGAIPLPALPWAGFDPTTGTVERLTGEPHA